jgi:hypothetical protein
MRHLYRLLYGAVCLNAWLALGWLVLIRDVGNAASPIWLRAATVVLLLAGPALIFVPVASRLKTPYFDLEAIIGWATLGFVVTFLTPSEPVGRGLFLALVLPLVVCVATVATLLAYLCSWRAAVLWGGRPNFLRARRRGYLASITLISLTLLGAYGVLSLAAGLILVTIAILVEAFLVMRTEPTERQAASPRPPGEILRMS